MKIGGVAQDHWFAALWRLGSPWRFVADPRLYLHVLCQPTGWKSPL